MQKKLAGMLSIIFTIVLCCGNYVLADSTYDIFTYTVSSQKVTITGCNSSASGTIVIPDVISGQTVTTIGEAAFQNRPNITEVIIPSTIAILPRNAFLNCTGLKNVKLPGTLNTISTSAFQGCTALETINTENVNILGVESFLNCSSLKSVNLSNATEVRKNAFRGCSSLETVTAFKKLLRLYQGAFNSCSALESVSLPASVNTIEEGVFSNCTSLQNIFVDDACTYVQDIDGVLCMGNVLYFFPTGRKGEVAIPDGIEIIGAKAFGTSTADSVYIPESVKTFRNRVFYMSTLESVVFPRTVETLGIELFGLCSNLKQICAPSKFAETEASWNNSALKATFYDYIVTYTKDGEVFTKEYVLAGEKADYPEIFSDSFNFYDENYNEWTGENITDDISVILEEKKPLSNNTNITVEYNCNGDIIEVQDWITKEDTICHYASVPSDIEDIALVVTPEDANAVVNVDEDISTDSFEYYITVTAEDGTTQLYYLFFEREFKNYREIVDVTPLTGIMAYCGNEEWYSNLPEVVEIIFEDGTNELVPVDWDVDAVDINTPNLYTVSGALILDDFDDITNPSGLVAEITVQLIYFQPIPTERHIVQVFQPTQVLLPYGERVEALLPDFVDVLFDDGSSESIQVLWDTSLFDYDNLDYQTIYGELTWDEEMYIVNPDMLNAEIEVLVLPLIQDIVRIIGFDSSDDITIPYGSLLSLDVLPKKVIVELEDGSTSELEIVWDISNVDTYVSRVYSVVGDIVLPEDITNTLNYTPKIAITVEEMPDVDLSLSQLSYFLNGEEYNITDSDKTAENEWTIYIPENEFTATMLLSVSAEAKDSDNTQLFINQPITMTGSGLQATISVSSVFDAASSVTYTVHFKRKALTWNVQFMVNGELFAEQTIKDGYPAYNPGPVDADGLEFAGWDNDFSCVTSDLVVNALFEEINNDEWAFWYVEKIDDLVIDSTMTIETLRALLPTEVFVFFRKGNQTMGLPFDVEWEIPEDFFARGADTQLLVAKFITSPDGSFIADKNVNPEVNISFAGSGESTTRYIISVSNTEAVTVPYNATESEIRAKLPQTVNVTLDNGSVKAVNVYWDLYEVDTTVPGTYNVMGGLLTGDEIQNPGMHKAYITLIVKPEENIGGDATGALRAEEITAVPGEEITVAITLDENLNTAVGRFLINFDREMLELVDYEIGDLIAGSTCVVNEAYDNNGETCMLVSYMNLSNIKDGGNVITLTLKVNDNAPGDTHYPISLESLDFFDYDENSVNVDKVDGDIHVIRYTLGDVNNNDRIDLLDAFRVLQYDVGLRNFTKTEMYAADVNADSRVNIADALLIQKFDAGLISEF